MNQDGLTNDQRADAARQALESIEKYCPFDEDSITDLIADLLHLAHQEGQDPRAILATAIMHFEAEQSIIISGGQVHVSAKA